MKQVDRRSLWRRLWHGGAALLTLLALAVWLCGCEEKQLTVKAEEGADGGPNIRNKKIEKAVAAAAQASASGTPDGQPPDTGVFGPGEAAKAHPPNSPAKIEVFQQGSEPRVSLAWSTDTQKSVRFRIVVVKAWGLLSLTKRLGDALPSVDYSLALELRTKQQLEAAAKEDEEKKADGQPAKPKAKPAQPEAKPEAKQPQPEGTAAASAPAPGEPDAGAKQAAEPAPAGPLYLVVTIEDASLYQEQPQAVRDELRQEVPKLKGTRIVFELAPEGSLIHEQTELAKGVSAQAEPLLRALREMLDLFHPPLPQQPVGAGALWMITDRAVVHTGVKVIRYRSCNVTAVDGDRISLKMDLRMYATDSSVTFAEAPGGLTTAAFQSVGKGVFELGPGGLMPLERTELALPFQLQMNQGDTPQAKLQVELTARSYPPAPLPETPAEGKGKAQGAGDKAKP